VFFILNVAVFGVSHGALDHLKCPPDKHGNSNVLRLSIFGVVYLAFAAAILYVWKHDPGPMLLGFLLISCLHFAADEDPNLRFAEKLLWGFLPILAPGFLHTKEVGQLFSYLAGSQIDFSRQLTAALRTVGFLALGLSASALLIKAFSALEKEPKSILSACLPRLSLLFSYIALPPLVSFTIYFCWWHSARQCLKLIAAFDPDNFRVGLKIFIKRAAPLTLGSWLFGLIIYCTIDHTNSSGQVSQQIRTIFYLLSALTVPHMFVVLFLDRDRSN
jgi:Brp/Blh family beta-carotene 15,15'-monooxygenase